MNKKQRKQIMGFSLALAVFSSANCLAQLLPTPAQEAKPGVRWWWMGSAVDKENLKWSFDLSKEDCKKTWSIDLGDVGDQSSSQSHRRARPERREMAQDPRGSTSHQQLLHDEVQRSYHRHLCEEEAHEQPLDSFRIL